MLPVPDAGGHPKVAAPARGRLIGVPAAEAATTENPIIDPYIIDKLSIINLNIYEAALDREEREVHT